MRKKPRAQGKQRKTARYRAQKKNRVQRKKSLSPHGQKVRRDRRK